MDDIDTATAEAEARLDADPPKKESWWKTPLLAEADMTEEELAHPLNPYRAADQRSSSQVVEKGGQLGELHQRRAQASPEKFNNGHFEPFALNLQQSDLPAATGLTAGLQSMWSKERSRPFSMMEALCDTHDVLLYLVAYLTVPDILNLYAISKRFHFLWNANYVAHIRASLRTWAPNGEEIFPWSCYKDLCIKDPYVRQKSRWEGKEHLAREPYEDKRDVPSLRWLQMVIYREGISYDILIQLALKGLRCTPKTSDAVKRLWFLIDLPLNSHRIALMRSTTYITNKTLLRMTGFMLKIDMFFTNPFGQPYPAGHSNERLMVPEWAGKTFTGVDLREYLLAEKSLTPLWRVLRGWSPDPSDPQIPMTRLDVLRLWARHKFQFPKDMLEPIKKMSFLGVPWYQIGTARLERVGELKHKYGTREDATVTTMAHCLPIPGHDKMAVPLLTATSSAHKPEVLYGPDELVMLEAIRRRLNMHKHWLCLMAYGLQDGTGRIPLPLPTEEELNRAIMNRPML